MSKILEISATVFVFKLMIFFLFLVAITEIVFPLIPYDVQPFVVAHCTVLALYFSIEAAIFMQRSSPPDWTMKEKYVYKPLIEEYFNEIAQESKVQGLELQSVSGQICKQRSCGPVAYRR